MPTPSPKQLEQEALVWLVRSTSGAMSSEQAEQLATWLAQSPAHREAFEANRQLWEGLGELQERPLLCAASHSKQNSTAMIRQSRRQPRLVSLATAASLLLCAGLWTANPDFWQIWQAQYHTKVGELQTVSLVDGSTVYLNTATALDSSFSDKERRLRLLDGEAEFIVSKDKSKPFVVEVDGYEIIALGTDFVVKKTRSKRDSDDAGKCRQSQLAAVTQLYVNSSEGGATLVSKLGGFVSNQPSKRRCLAQASSDF